MAPTPSWKMNQGHSNMSKTPLVKRLHFTAGRMMHNSPNPSSAVKENQAAAEHPVEVVGRIRHYPERKENGSSVVQANSEGCSIRVKADFGYRDFGLDGISTSEEEDLERFYNKFVESRVSGVKIGGKCTVMMYGPTGSGKSYTMFGCSKQQGIVYRCLKDILQEEGEEEEEVGTLVHVTVLEIYNEEIYDLLSTNNGGGCGGSAKGNSSKVRLEVMGKKAKNASFISGKEAGKIAKEIEKVEKRRIVKSTLCNERSSRSHCMIIMDVPSVGGRLMLVDMAGSENIDQAGQGGLEAKIQTAKINQGNIALKRVVESIANADSHVPFRDSKLTMLLQDSFEDDKSKILMILCVSPDPKEVFKTVLTLEYGAKAKCIVRGSHSPSKDTPSSQSHTSMLILGSRLAAMDHFISKLQTENRLKEKLLSMKEDEVSQLRARLVLTDRTCTTAEEEINQKVKEQTQHLRSELERKVQHFQNMADHFVELSRRKMEEKTTQHQKEVQTLLLRLEELESKLLPESPLGQSTFARRMTAVWGGDEVPGMVMSMDLDTGDQEETRPQDSRSITCPLGDPVAASPANGPILSTVFEEEVEGEEEVEVEEVKKEVIEEGTVYSTNSRKNSCHDDTASSKRRVRINNIFTLCGNNREISQKSCITTTTPLRKEPGDDVSFELGSVKRVNGFVFPQPMWDEKLKENRDPDDDQKKKSRSKEVYVSKEMVQPVSPLFLLNPIENNKHPVTAGKKSGGDRYHSSHIVPVIVPRC